MHILPRHHFEESFGQEVIPGHWGKLLEDCLAEETIDQPTEMKIIQVIQEQTCTDKVDPAICKYNAEYITYLLWDRFAKLCVDEGAAVDDDNFDIVLPKRTLANGQDVGYDVCCAYQFFTANGICCRFCLGPLSYSVQLDYGKYVPHLMNLGTTDRCKFPSDTLRIAVTQDTEGLVYFYTHMNEYVKKVKQVLCHFNAECNRMNKAIIKQAGSTYEF